MSYIIFGYLISWGYHHRDRVKAILTKLSDKL